MFLNFTGYAYSSLGLWHFKMTWNTMEYIMKVIVSLVPKSLFPSSDQLITKLHVIYFSKTNCKHFHSLIPVFWKRALVISLVYLWGWGQSDLWTGWSVGRTADPSSLFITESGHPGDHKAAQPQLLWMWCWQHGATGLPEESWQLMN